MGGGIITQEIYEAEAKNTVFIPVLFPPTPPRHSSRAAWLEILRALRAEGYDLLYRRVTHQPLIVKPELGSRRPMPPRERTPSMSLEVDALTSPPTAEQPRFEATQATSKEGSERASRLASMVETRVEQPTPSAQTGLPYQGEQVLSAEQQAPHAAHHEIRRPRVAFWRRGVGVGTSHRASPLGRDRRLVLGCLLS